jgi:two-component system CheB/CheR fusion protein
MIPANVQAVSPSEGSDIFVPETKFDVAHDALIGLSCSGVVRSWNAGAVRLFGCTLAQAAGRPLSIFIDPGHVDEFEKLLDVACAGACPGPIEVRCRRRDGNAPIAHLALIPILDNQGRITALAAAIRDMSAWRQAEAKRALVVEELDHRINNTIAVVGAIAALSLRNATSLKAFGNSFAARLRALSATHQMLARNAWRKTALAALVETELAPYGDPINSPRWRMAGDDMQVDRRQAEALSMVLHELATNAAKYGALSVPDGQVRISWEVIEQRLKFAWVESNGPAVVNPTRSGFGTRLITEGIALELGGVGTLSYAPSGINYTLNVPLQIGEMAMNSAEPNLQTIACD